MSLEKAGIEIGQKLNDRVAWVVNGVVKDERWKTESDDIGVNVLGIILYGFAMAEGRMTGLLTQEQIEESVFLAITTHVGSAPKWTSGMITYIREFALDQSKDTGKGQFLSVGTSYLGLQDLPAIVGNIFANIASYRGGVVR